MPRPISAEIDLEALRHNLGVMRSKAAGRALWAVVKANAYGHGLDNAVTAFADADGLATIDLCDAEIVRRCGWHKRILLLEGFFDAADIEPLQTLKVETVVHSPWQIAILRAAKPKDVRVHVKVNSGMNRLGFRPAEAPAAAAQLAAIPGVRVMDYVTHFANADNSVGEQRMAAEKHQQTADGFEKVREEHDSALGHRVSKDAHPGCQKDVAHDEE